MKRFISLILALTAVVAMTSAPIAYAAEGELVLQELNYTEKVGDLAQPDCGITNDVYLYSGKMTENDEPRNDSGFVRYIVSLEKWSKACGYEDKKIDEWFINYLDKSLENLDSNGGYCILHVTYTKEGSVYPTAGTDALKEQQLQLCELITKYTDTVLVIESNMIVSSAWGDYSRIKNEVIRTWLNNTPDSVTVNLSDVGEYISFVNEEYVNAPDFEGKYPLLTKLTEKNYHEYTDIGESSRLGIFNENMISDTPYDYGVIPSGSGYVKFFPWLGEKSCDTFYGGKVIPEDEYIMESQAPYHVIPFLYEGALSYYYGSDERYLSFPEDWNGITLSKYSTISAIQEKLDGADISAYSEKSAMEFMRDHVGYRYVLRESLVSSTVSRGGVVKLIGIVDNTGFARSALDKNVDIIITNGTDNYELTTDISLDDWIGGKRNNYNIEVKLPLGIEAGEYSVYIRIVTRDGKYAVAFANEGDGYNAELGANLLGSFTVGDEVVAGSDDSIKQVYTTFNDTVGHWAEKNIEQICTIGYMGGVTVGRFTPDEVATRAQMLTVFYNIEGRPDVSDKTTPFTDISGWYEDAVTWAYGEGIVNGVTPTTFAPNGRLTRETFATMLYRYAKYKGCDVRVSVSAIPSGFTDAGKISSWALESMIWAVNRGYINGMTATTLAPSVHATRAQMATILMRFINSPEPEKTILDKYGLTMKVFGAYNKMPYMEVAPCRAYLTVEFIKSESTPEELPTITVSAKLTHLNKTVETELIKDKTDDRVVYRVPENDMRVLSINDATVVTGDITVTVGEDSQTFSTAVRLITVS